MLRMHLMQFYQEFHSEVIPSFLKITHTQEKQITCTYELIEAKFSMRAAK